MLPVLTNIPTRRDRAKYTIKHALHTSSTVNANNLSVDPVTVLGGKEADDAGDIYWLANTVVGRPCAGVLIDLVVTELVTSGDVLAAHGVVHVSLDASRCYAVDSNFLLSGIY